MFALFGTADDDLAALDVPEVKGVHGLAGLQKDEVCDVHDVVDGAHAGALDAAFHPVGRFLDPEVFDHPSHIAGAEVEVLHGDLHAVIGVATHGVIGGDRHMELFLQSHRHLSCDP